MGGLIPSVIHQLDENNEPVRWSDEVLDVLNWLRGTFSSFLNRAYRMEHRGREISEALRAAEYPDRTEHPEYPDLTPHSWYPKEPS